MDIKRIQAFLFCLLLSTGMQAQTRISVMADQPGAEIQPTMWGIFFEDINFGADGGLYAEMVKNRSFQFPDPFMGWTVPFRDSVRMINETVEGKVHRYLRLSLTGAGGAASVRNDGFRGMGIRAGEEYRLTVSLRRVAGTVSLKAELLNAAGNPVAEAEVNDPGSNWSREEVILKAGETDAKGSLRLMLNGKGVVDLDYISLFPVNTYKNRINGMRRDIAELLEKLHPGFLRFPGGCIVEGQNLALRYQWKKTTGPVENRETIINRWNTEFMHRHTPDYFQSFGLGFYEYFVLAEDIGAEPLPILNCGMACQYNSGELASPDEMQPYIDDALDLIGFANGDPATGWGKLRAEMGHPEPFNLKLLGIGNEQWGEQYLERYELLAKKVREKYPEVKLVAAAGPSPDGARFDYLWKELRTKPADLVDEHYYKEPEWFFSNAGRYDAYDRQGPNVFAGEYASHTRVKDDDPASNNNWLSALSEAAFMTGLERNADVVHMASYAPLLAHVEAWQWRPDLIWFDNLRAMATPNYYVQQLFSTHRGTNVIPVLHDQQSLKGENGLYASASADPQKKQIYLKIVNSSTQPNELLIDLHGKKVNGKQVNLVTLASADPMSYNTLDDPARIVPEKSVLPVKGNAIQLKMEPRSFKVIGIAYR